MSEPVPPRARLKTYSHLSAQRKIPSEYEITTSRLFYHPSRGFEVATPLADFYARHQQGSPLRARDWDEFADPRQTTYAKYTALMSQREAFVDRLFERAAPSELWQALSVWRFPLHGLQMTAAYVGQMAPAGRITICCALQAADELRRIQRIAYGMALSHVSDAESRARWQSDERFQPLRKLIEQLLVVRDWGEAFAALCLGVKPVLDGFVNETLLAGDPLLREIGGSFAQDSAWHAEWSRELARFAIEDSPANQPLLDEWSGPWRERALGAIEKLR